MSKDLSTKKIENKFRELISLDEDKKHELQQSNEKQQMFTQALLQAYKTALDKPTETKTNYKEKINEENSELIFTKSDICKEVAKLKPYLKKFNNALTTVEAEDLMNKEISDDQKNCMSDLIIHLNKKLCERLRDHDQQKEKQQTKRENKQKEGWIYEVFYRVTDHENASELNQIKFKNGYIVLTEILELFPNLSFEQNILKLSITEVKRIKYFQENEFQIIDIRFNNSVMHIGFLNETQMKLFDRMLFLIKNMARTSTSRLFQNQLMKNIYSEY